VPVPSDSRSPEGNYRFAQKRNLDSVIVNPTVLSRTCAAEAGRGVVIGKPGAEWRRSAIFCSLVNGQQEKRRPRNLRGGSEDEPASLLRDLIACRSEATSCRHNSVQPDLNGPSDRQGNALSA